MNTGVFSALISGQEATGSAGNVTMTADTIHLTNSTIVAIADLGGRGGDITLSARDIQLREFSGLGASGFERSGNIRIEGQSVMTDSSQMDVSTWLNPGGGITITGNAIEFRNGSTISSNTNGDGTAGTISITATDHLTLSDDPSSFGRQSTIRLSSIHTDAQLLLVVLRDLSSCQCPRRMGWTLPASLRSAQVRASARLGSVLELSTPSRQVQRPTLLGLDTDRLPAEEGQQVAVDLVRVRGRQAVGAPG